MKRDKTETADQGDMETPTWLTEARQLLEQGNPLAALTALEAGLSDMPDCADGWRMRGMILRNDLDRYEEAIASYDQALKYKPDFGDAWCGRGATLVELHRYEKAIASYDQALKYNPDDHKAWNNRGVALSDLHRHEEAIASHDQALKYKPDLPKAWVNRGIALRHLHRCEEAIANHDQALKYKPDFPEAWNNRGVAAYNSNGVNKQSVTLPPSMQNPALDQRNYPGQLASLREGLKYCKQDTHPEGWGTLHRRIGNAHCDEGNYKENPRPCWRDALRSYHTALQTLTADSFPEPHLQVLQGMIRAHLALDEIPAARRYQQQGITLFEQLRAAQPDSLKPTFETRFASFSQREIDLLIGENNPIAALKQAEFYKNRCLTWILDAWQETVLSPDAAEMQSLCNPHTAIFYWHLSPDRLTTFILTNGQPPQVLACNRRQQSQQFETWMQNYDRQYRDYASQKKESSKRSSHPWRTTLESQLAKLRNILHIDDLCEQLPPTVHTLILLPHRDLHRFPLHALFPDRFTVSYLPSCQIGLNLRDRKQTNTYLSLLNVDDPQTDQPEMPFAQLESAIVRHLIEDATHISPADASCDCVIHHLQKPYKTFHFTGHAAYNSRKPEDSAIALTDARLTAKQISRLNLSSYNLICLASCETAVTGKDSIATEYVGLSTAFLKAGAANVLSTLWQVDEISSAWLMIRFYQALLAGDAPAVALKQAQHWLKTVTYLELIGWLNALTVEGLSYRWRKELEVQVDLLKEQQGTIKPSDRPYNQPFYWAAFTLTGSVP
ncbi:CHAT domain-containing protein [Phormidesmis sp. 146-33]